MFPPGWEKKLAAELKKICDDELDEAYFRVHKKMTAALQPYVDALHAQGLVRIIVGHGRVLVSHKNDPSDYQGLYDDSIPLPKDITKLRQVVDIVAYHTMNAQLLGDLVPQESPEKTWVIFGSKKHGEMWLTLKKSYEMSPSLQVTTSGAPCKVYKQFDAETYEDAKAEYYKYNGRKKKK